VVGKKWDGDDDLDDDPATPTEVTKEWIKNQRWVSTHLEQCLINHLHSRGSGSEARTVGALPIGFRRFYYYWRFWTDVDNGGFRQFFGNAGAVGERGKIVANTVESLRRFGMHYPAGLLQAAIVVAAADLPRSALSALPKRVRHKAEKRRKPSATTEAETEDGLRILDLKFNALKYSYQKTFEIYVKNHPDEFAHPIRPRTGLKQSSRKRRPTTKYRPR